MTALLLVFSGMLAGMPGECGEGRIACEDLFKWGEYDSLISVLEPLRADGRGDSILGALASREDSLEEARARMYLGVAYWAKGRPDAGVEAFQVATRLDPTLRLDPLYATPEMAARFEQLADPGGAKPETAPQAPAPGPAREDGDREPRPRRAGKADWTRLAVAAAAGATVVGGAVGAYYLVQYLQRPRETIIPIDPE